MQRGKNKQTKQNTLFTLTKWIEIRQYQTQVLFCMLSNLFYKLLTLLTQSDKKIIIIIIIITKFV